MGRSVRTPTGIDNVCPPLCKWSDLHDGTYTITDVLRFHIAMDEEATNLTNG